MDSAEIGEYIESVAVRIELGGTGCVAGTGVLYTLQAEKRAVILTAGHVLSKNVTGTNTCQAILSVRVQDTVKDMELTLSGVESGGTPNVYFCPGFQKDHNDRYLFDGAMIEVGWEDWMKDVPELQLARARISMKLQTIGFPESGDVQVPPNNRIQGRKSLKAEVSGSAEPDAEKSFKFDYTGNTTYPVPREDCMRGYSGSGLFCIDSKMPMPQLVGLVSQSFGAESAGNTAWAVSSYALELLLREQKVIPETSDFQRAAVNLTGDLPEPVAAFLQKVFNQLDMQEEQLQKTHQEQFFPQKFACDAGKRCLHYWKGREITAAYIWTIKGSRPDSWENVQIDIKTTAEEILPVNLEYLCAEEELNSVLHTLVEEGGFSETGFPNRALFIVNNRKGLRNARTINRRHCSNVIRKITQQAPYSGEDNKNRMFHVTRGDTEKMEMMIVSLDFLNGVLESLSMDKVDQNLKQKNVRKDLIEKLEGLWNNG